MKASEIHIGNLYLIKDAKGSLRIVKVTTRPGQFSKYFTAVYITTGRETHFTARKVRRACIIEEAEKAIARRTLIQEKTRLERENASLRERNERDSATQ